MPIGSGLFGVEFFEEWGEAELVFSGEEELHVELDFFEEGNQGVHPREFFSKIDGFEDGEDAAGLVSPEDGFVFGSEFAIGCLSDVGVGVEGEFGKNDVAG